MINSVVNKLLEKEIYCVTFNSLCYQKLKPSGKPKKEMRGMPKGWARSFNKRTM